MVVMKFGEAVGMGWGSRPTTAAVATAVARLHTARRWFLAALPGTQDTPRTANPPFDRNKTYFNNAARNMRTPCGHPACLVTAHRGTCQFHNLFALFYRLTDV
jgi:hypothetical protein